MPDRKVPNRTFKSREMSFALSVVRVYVYVNWTTVTHSLNTKGHGAWKEKAWRLM